MTHRGIQLQSTTWSMPLTRGKLSNRAFICSNIRTQWVVHEILETAQSPNSIIPFLFDLGLWLGLVNNKLGPFYIRSKVEQSPQFHDVTNIFHEWVEVASKALNAEWMLIMTAQCSDYCAEPRAVVIMSVLFISLIASCSGPISMSRERESRGPTVVTSQVRTLHYFTDCHMNTRGAFPEQPYNV